MKTATVREVRQNFGRLLDWINSGEEITITMHRKAVARITPLAQVKAKKPVWPDFQARQKAVFGVKTLKSSLVTTERDSYPW